MNYVMDKLYLQDKPREKLIEKGADSLKEYELIAIILSSGTKNIPLLKLSKNIEKYIKKNVEKITVKELLAIKGIGKAKACQIIAAFELSKRLLFKENTSIKITSPIDIANVAIELYDKKQEHFITITLDGANNIIEKRTIFIGTLNSSLIHPREVFADAITDRAASVIFIHNHPSGTLEPSREDLSVTQRLVEAGTLLGIEVLDHVIMANKRYYSLKANGIID